MTISPNAFKSIKQGATFIEVIPPTVASGLGLTDLVGVVVESSIVTLDAAEHSLAVVIPDPTGLGFTLSSQTEGWKLGDAHWDIKFTLPSGRIIYSNTILIQIIKHYTS